MSLARANIFPCATFQVEKAQHTSRLLRQDTAGVTSSSACLPRTACTPPDPTLKEDYDRLVRLLWRGWPVALEVKSRFDFSCCIWFWFGSRHLKCDTTAILRPRPSSSIRKEFKARTLTFFFPRWKSKVSVPWWYCGTTEVVSGGRPREIPDLLCSNAIDVSPPPASFLTRTLELITNQGRTTLSQYVSYSKQI